MYAPRSFREERVPVLHRAIREVRLATLVTLGADGLTASHLPLLLDLEPAPYGTLVGHLARANPQWRDLSPSAGGLAVFLGPEAYVSPSFYETKRQTGRVVPTWNYLAVHARGPVTLITEPADLRALVGRLTDASEAGRPEPWGVGDAPGDYVEGMLRGIVGVRLRIERLEGTWKLSQNRSGEDRAGVVAGLAASADPRDRAVASLMSAEPLPEGEP